MIPTGAQLASFQVSWSGKDGVAQRDIAFSGVISVVAIESIQGTRQTTTRVDDSAVANTTTDQQNTNSTSGDSRNASTTETITTTSNTQQTGGNNQGQAVTEGSDSSIVRTTTDASQFANQSLGVSDRTQTTADTTTVNTTTVTQNDFVLTDANTQYRLRGSWVENGA